jgi:hypothetical protein
MKSLRIIHSIYKKIGIRSYQNLYIFSQEIGDTARMLAG